MRSIPLLGNEIHILLNIVLISEQLYLLDLQESMDGRPKILLSFLLLKTSFDRSDLTHNFWYIVVLGPNKSLIFVRNFRVKNVGPIYPNPWIPWETNPISKNSGLLLS